MKTLVLLSALCLASSSLCASDLRAAPTLAPAAAETAPAPQAHPLKGVVMGLLPEKTALLVKHEEVPGVMRAMTMLFKVDPEVLTRVKPGHTITALMSRRADGWWLTDVVVVEPSPTPVAP